MAIEEEFTFEALFNEDDGNTLSSSQRERLLCSGSICSEDGGSTFDFKGGSLNLSQSGSFSEVPVDPLTFSNKKPSWDDYEIIRMVGKGAYGQVYQARHIGTGNIYAIKVLKKDYLMKENAISYTITEKEILSKIRHPFIVNLYGTFQTDDRVAFVMEYINGGQLFFHLRNYANFDENGARFYCAELILALEHLHTNDIVHRDLKPENILINSKGHVVLTDFGLAKEEVVGDNASTFCGTLEYMAPEMVKGQKYGKAADFWSVGILLYDMLSGQPPFKHRNNKKLQQLILTKKNRNAKLLEQKYPLFNSRAH